MSTQAAHRYARSSLPSLLVDLDLHVLHRSSDMKHVFFAIGLYDGQSERRYPANGTICVSNLEKSSQRKSCSTMAAILLSHAMMVVAPLLVTPIDPNVNPARYIDNAYSISSSKSIFLSSRRAYASSSHRFHTLSCPSICSRAPTNVTP